MTSKNEAQQVLNSLQVLSTEKESLSDIAENAQWVLLDFEQSTGKGLVISKDCVARKPYHQTREKITWENCSLRLWLNSEFLNSLPVAMQARVFDSKIINEDNSRYGTAGGNPTTDKVFCLSIHEAEVLFPFDDARKASYQGSGAWWWLRSPGFTDTVAAYVHTDGDVSYGSHYSHDVTVLGGVCPAFYLDLNS
jgi:hypothetical protein